MAFDEQKDDRPGILDKIASIGQNQGKQLHEKMMSRDLFNSTDIRQKTRLSVNEIILVQRGFFLADYFEEKGYSSYAKMLKSYYMGVLGLRPSLDGLSRDEFVKVLGKEIEQATVEKASGLVMK